MPKKRDNTYHVFRRKRSEYWYCWYEDNGGKRIQKATDFPLNVYIRQQVEMKLNGGGGIGFLGEKQNPNIDWLAEYLPERLEIKEER